MGFVYLVKPIGCADLPRAVIGYTHSNNPDRILRQRFDKGSTVLVLMGCLANPCVVQTELERVFDRRFKMIHPGIYEGDVNAMREAFVHTTLSWSETEL